MRPGTRNKIQLLKEVKRKRMKIEHLGKLVAFTRYAAWHGKGFN